MEDIVANTNPDFMETIPSARDVNIAKLFLRNEDAYNVV